jgi:hypothetical protein
MDFATVANSKKKWCPHNINALCWSFYCVNDNSKVNLDVPQMKRYLFCHSQPIVSMNSRKKLKKGLITYYKTSGICLQKTSQCKSFSNL